MYLAKLMMSPLRKGDLSIYRDRTHTGDVLERRPAEAPPCYEAGAQTSRRTRTVSAMLTVYAGQVGKLRGLVGLIAPADGESCSS